jgi:pyruvate formate lyase activating enzyme
MIPTLNDDPTETRKLAEWVLKHLGPDVPLHFTAFHPDFKLRDKPKTPPETLHNARAVAQNVGLHYVYEGNIFSDGAHTSCSSCGTLLIRRSWHHVEENLLKDGACPNCDLAIPGRWADPHRSTPIKTFERAHEVAAQKYDHLNL